MNRFIIAFFIIGATLCVAYSYQANVRLNRSQIPVVYPDRFALDPDCAKFFPQSVQENMITCNSL